MPRGAKTLNDYCETLSQRFFADCPKTVLAAIAVSFASHLRGVEGEESFDGIEDDLRREWAALHTAGIVPQKPPR